MDVLLSVNQAQILTKMTSFNMSNTTMDEDDCTSNSNFVKSAGSHHIRIAQMVSADLANVLFNAAVAAVVVLADLIIACCCTC